MLQSSAHHITQGRAGSSKVCCEGRPRCRAVLTTSPRAEPTQCKVPPQTLGPDRGSRDRQTDPKSSALGYAGRGLLKEFLSEQSRRRV